MKTNSIDSYRIQNREIRLEVTNMCNAKCIMCPREKMSRPKGILDMNLYTDVLDQAYKIGATVVSLENYGESLLDDHFFKRAAYARNKGMVVYTITNGYLFNKDCAQKSIYSLDKIRFSVHGTTKEVYESVHRGLNFETVIANIEYIIEEKKRLNSNTPRIEVYFLLMDENKQQVQEFKNMWLGRVDDIAIWKPHNWSDGRKYRIPENDRKKVTCGRPRCGPIQVQWDGLVVPCCFDYNSMIVLGDLKKQSLYEVLSGEEYNRLRKAHAEGQFSLYPFCNSCDQLCKREDALVFSTIKESKVGAMNTTYDQVG